MTTRHFVRLAQYIIAAQETGPFSAQQIECLADFCQEANPQFRRGRWIDYINGKCGPQGEKV